MSKKFYLAVTIIVAFLVSGCRDQLNDSKEIYKVIFVKVEYPGKAIHLKSSVASPKLKITRKEDQEYFDSFRFLNNTTTHKQPYFENLNIVLIDERELKSIFKQSCEQDWRTFHKMYPEAGTLFAVSHVGFTSDRKRAIVYLEGATSCQDSEGVLFGLEKTDEEWKIIDFINL